MKIKFAPIGAGIVLLFAACNQNGFNKETTADVKYEEVYEAADSTAGNAEQQQGNPIVTQQPAANPDWERKIIRTATLTIEAEDYNKYYSFMRESLRRAGGYVATEEQARTEYRLENTVTVKVPVMQFEEAMHLLTTGTGKDKVMERKINSQDVTTEVVDTKSRMEAKREVRLRYLELLRQANKMEDILKVQNEINEIQEQIEMATGRVNYLNHASALSTIQLTFYQVLNPGAPSVENPSFFTKLWEAFEKGWGFIKNIIIGIITIWPLLLGGFVLWLMLRKRVARAVVREKVVGEQA
jgi:hypothetical protein